MLGFAPLSSTPLSSLPNAGGGSVTYNVALTATQASAASVLKVALLTKLATQGASASLVKLVSIVKSVTQASSASVFKLVGLIKTASLSSTASVVASFLYMLTLTAAVSVSAVLSLVVTVGGNVIDWLINARRRGTR